MKTMEAFIIRGEINRLMNGLDTTDPKDESAVRVCEKLLSVLEKLDTPVIPNDEGPELTETEIEASVRAYAWQTDENGKPVLEMFPGPYKRGFIDGANWKEERMLDGAIKCDIDPFGYLTMEGERDILVSYPFDFEMPTKAIIIKEH